MTDLNISGEMVGSGINTDGFGLAFLIIIGVIAAIMIIKFFIDHVEWGSLANSKYKKIESTSFNKNKYKNLVGVEIECIKKDRVGIKLMNELNFFEGDDGSIKAGNGTGVEYRSSPIQGDKLLENIDNFSKELNRTNHKVNKSCGLHIHIETPPELELLKKLYTFYSKYEGLFFSMLPESRQDNKYCKKFKRVDKFNYNDVLKIKEMKDFKELYYETNNFYPINDHSYDKRYCWINFHSIFYRGTLEIRGHSGTINSNKINKWIMMHLIIRDYLDKNSVDKIAKMRVSKEAFLKMFPNDLKNYIKERWEVFPDVAEENFKEYK